MNRIERICLIGFGEVGQILADDLSAHAALAAWDLKFRDRASIPRQALQGRSVRAAANAAEAAQEADLVISAVTAAQTAEAASAACAGIKSAAFFLDLNSASPGAKQEAARLISAAGGRYVEAAVMSAFPPKRIGSPILLGGPDAQAFLPVARDLGFAGASFLSDEIGPASATKLCRSVIVKGIEALLAESMLAARRYGVERAVLGSLGDFFPGTDWPALSRYMIARSIEHGVRRAEEMREAAHTVAEADVAPLMSKACAARQEWAAQFSDALRHDALADMLDALRARSGPGAAPC
jgi:3-hydroxyisobutyrate dehydrogenase-like beta-hydroxyacid dehydrogenase